MYKLLLWGTGGFAEKYLLYVEDVISAYDIEIIGFCDNDPKKWGYKYKGYNVYSPDKIKELAFDKVIIFVYPDIFPGILDQLVTKLDIDRERTGYITDILKITQRLRRRSLVVRQTRRPVIYDCFPFFNELEVLKIRLKLLSPYVDYFVLVEMGKTHRGEDKPLYYELNKDMFAEYTDKIIHIVPNDIPKYTGKNTKKYMNAYEGKDWTLENFQRSCIARGLNAVEPEDLICISDCDEIINPELLIDFKGKDDMPARPLWLDMLDEQALVLNQSYHYYFFNCVLGHKQNTSIFVRYKNLTDIQHLRLMLNYLPQVENGGWHLTYFGGADQVIKKASAIVEGREISEEEAAYRIKNRIDPYGRTGSDFEMRFIPKEQITIPYIDELIEEYPQFYYRREET